MRTWGALLQEANKHIKIMTSIMVFEMAFATICTILAFLYSYIAILKPEQWITAILCFAGGSNMVGCCCKSVKMLDKLYAERARIKFYGEMVGWDK